VCGFLFTEYASTLLRGDDHQNMKNYSFLFIWNLLVEVNPFDSHTQSDQAVFCKLFFVAFSPQKRTMQKN